MEGDKIQSLLHIKMIYIPQQQSAIIKINIRNHPKTIENLINE